MGVVEGSAGTGVGSGVVGVGVGSGGTGVCTGVVGVGTTGAVST